jgi:hypothetical protein
MLTLICSLRKPRGVDGSINTSQPVRVDGFVMIAAHKLTRAAELLERDGDEHGVGRELRRVVARAHKGEGNG